MGDTLTTTLHLPSHARAAEALRKPPPGASSAAPAGGSWSPLALPAMPGTPNSASGSDDSGSPPSPASAASLTGFESSVSREQALALESAAHAQAAGPGLQTLPQVRNRSIALVKDWAEKKAQAEAAGVDLRKKTFINKLISTGASLITLSAAVMLTVATGGAALPFLAIAAVRTTLLIGDTLCAWEDRRRAMAVPPQPRLPLGANCLGNAIHGLGRAMGLGDDRARTVGKYGSGLVLVGLATAGIAVALPHEGIALTSAVMRYLSSAGGMAGTSSQAHASDAYDQRAQARDEAAAELHKDLLAAAQSPQMREETYQAWCDELAEQLPAASAQTREDLALLMKQAYDARHSEKTPDLVGADRATTAMRLVNDVVGLHAFGSFSLTALAHGGVLSLA